MNDPILNSPQVIPPLKTGTLKVYLIIHSIPIHTLIQCDSKEYTFPLSSLFYPVSAGHLKTEKFVNGIHIIDFYKRVTEE